MASKQLNTMWWGKGRAPLNVIPNPSRVLEAPPLSEEEKAERKRRNLEAAKAAIAARYGTCLPG